MTKSSRCIVARLKKDFPEEIASEGDPVGMQIDQWMQMLPR